MTQKGRVAPFGDPRIKGCSPLPAAFRSVPRPSSPLSAKASTKCPYALDPMRFRRTQRADPPHAASTPRLILSTSFYPPGRSPGSLPLELSPKPGNPLPTASRIPIHNVKDQISGIRHQGSEEASTHRRPDLLLVPRSEKKKLMTGMEATICRPFSVIGLIDMVKDVRRLCRCLRTGGGRWRAEGFFPTSVVGRLPPGPARPM